MPSLSVRSFSELLNLPAYEQARILHEQKYPKSGPSAFKIPYYAKSLSAIRSFYKSDNDIKVLRVFIRDINYVVKPDSKKKHNLRVLESFESGVQFDRKLVLKSNKKYYVNISDVEIRLYFDIKAEEDGTEKMIFYNFRNAEISDNLARITLEISNFILIENGYKIPFRNLEFVDLFTNKVYGYSKVRKRTLNLMKSNIDIIEALWSTI